WVARTGRGASFDLHAGTADEDAIYPPVANWDELRSKGRPLLVTSSFAYDRFFRGARMTGQHPYVYEAAAKYEELFDSFEYVELAPAFKSIAFSNPVIRIVDLTRKRSTE